jgi:BirA family biotin operon repressor/biotin-[acetyl-CoA-carboxylase] ligase
MEIHKFESINSTNSALVEFSKKNAKSWTVFWTTNQTKGRGYSGNQWLINANENLAVSVLIKSELNYQDLIYFNQWVSNVVHEMISQYSPDVFVKWPNDIILKDKKICGILIETHKSGNELNIIVGLGININQMHFENISKAGSLANILHKKFDIEEILSDLLTKMENSFHLIQNKNWNIIHNRYNENLYRKGFISKFKRNEMEFEAIIQGVDEFGRLILKLENHQIQKFQHKEIEIIY